MAIQMRRGQKADFDPTKMLPGEWAVSIDSDTNNQIVWMCFRAGVVKRMGTWEDFRTQIAEATADIRKEYIEDFNAILAQVDALASKVQTNTDSVIVINNNITNVYLPQILQNAENASASAARAENSANLSKSYSVGTDGVVRENDATDNSKYYSERSQASSQTAQSYAEQAEAASDEVVNRINEAVAQNVPQFIVDFTTGHLLYQGGRFDFIVNEPTGHLLWEVAI